MRVCLLALVVLTCARLAAEDERSVQQLIAALGSDDAEEREKATSALIQRGAEAEPGLREALASSDAEVHARAKRALGQIALDRKIGPSAWVNIPAGTAPVEDLFREVARQAHREFESSQVDLSGRTYAGLSGRMEIWTAIDLLARAANCSYEFPFDKRIVLRNEPFPPQPMFHHGPLRLEVLGVDDSGWPNLPDHLCLLVRCEPHTDIIAETVPTDIVLDAPGRGSLIYGALLFRGRVRFGDEFHFGRPAFGTGTGFARVPLVLRKKDLPPRLRVHGSLRVLFVRERAETGVDVKDDSAHVFHGFGWNIRYFRAEKRKLSFCLGEGLQGDLPSGIELPSERVFGHWAKWSLSAGKNEEVPLTGPIFGEEDEGNYAGHWTLDNPPAGPYSLHVSVVTRVISTTLDIDLDNLDLRALPDPWPRAK